MSQMLLTGAGLGSGSSSLLQSLVSYWKMDEASGDAVDAHGANALTDNATVTSGAGKVGTARQFTAASSEYFSVADNASLSTGNIDFTFAVWVLMDSKTGLNMTIIGKDSGATPNREYQLRHDNASDRFNFYIFDGTNLVGTASATTFGSPALATWYFIVCYHDSVNSRVGISVNDGAVNDAAATGDPADGAAQFNIGARTGSAFWDGRIDEVGFWKRLLTPAEKTHLYDAGAGRAYPF